MDNEIKNHGTCLKNRFSNPSNNYLTYYMEFYCFTVSSGAPPSRCLHQFHESINLHRLPVVFPFTHNRGTCASPTPDIRSIYDALLTHLAMEMQ